MRTKINIKRGTKTSEGKENTDICKETNRREEGKNRAREKKEQNLGKT